MYDDATILNGPGMREASPGKTAIQGGPVVLMFVKRLDLEAEMIQERTFDVQYSYGHSYDTKLYNFWECLLLVTLDKRQLGQLELLTATFSKCYLHEKEMLITAAGHSGRAIWVKMMKMVACVAFNRDEELNMLSNTG